MTAKQRLLVAAALVVLLLQSLTIGYLALDAPRQRAEQYQAMVNAVTDGVENTRNAFKAECGIDHQAPAEALHALVTELRNSTTKLQSCEKGLEALQGLTELRRLPRAFRCDGATEDGCFEGSWRWALRRPSFVS